LRGFPEVLAEGGKVLSPYADFSDIFYTLFKTLYMTR
jgi:hypothetical protein